MRPLYLLTLTALLAALPAAYAQEAAEDAPSAAAPEPAGEAAPTPETQVVQPSAADERGDRQAVPRGSRPRGDNPQTGWAVPREAAPPPPRQAPRTYDPRSGVYVEPRGIYRNRGNYYYPRQYYPYGYGAFGLGYFYYDPYRWGPTYYGYGGYYSAPRFGQGAFGYDVGQLRLRVSPRHAEVYVDGYYAGTVDDYDGTFQALNLESGGYQIELVAPGYEPLEFKVRINPGQTITYRGDLRRLP